MVNNNNNNFHLPLTPSQVGTYFIGQYYKVLQQQPDYLHHFYTASSTMLRIDGTTRHTATSLTQIHSLATSLNYTGVEIKTANSLESWNRGVLVMVSGLMRSKHFNRKKKFMEFFFLAPQDKGYFVLNNMFHIIDDEPLYPQSIPLLSQNNQGYLPKVSATGQKAASHYVMGRETRAWDSVSPATTAEENDPADNYSFFSEQQLQQIFDAKFILENNYTQFNCSRLNSAESVHVQSSHPAEESRGNPEKHSYASVAKMQPKDHIPKPSRQKPVASSTAIKKFSTTEGELKSVYLKNLPSDVTPFQIEEVFKKFGRLKPFEGVFIRNHEDIGVCFGFVEFEDVISVQNAIKASKVVIAGREVSIEKRRPDKVGKRRGRGRGRGGKRH